MPKADAARADDARVLSRVGVRPDETASSNRRVTQRISADLHARGHAGPRWWSTLTGDWHMLVLFRDPTQGKLSFGHPEPLALSHASVIEATRAPGIAIKPGCKLHGATSSLKAPSMH